MNNTKNSLYLASQSPSRQELLQHAHIPFVAIGHTACETTQTRKSLEQNVGELAVLKMEHACLPQPTEIRAHEIFVLTADTLTCDMQGNIYGKPRDRDHAIAMIKTLRSGTRVATGFCLDKKESIAGKWHTHKRIASVVSADCFCDVPDAWIDRYLYSTPALHVAGSLVVDGYGALFVKSIKGSYSTIVGLPLAEIREALDACGFF